MSQLTPREKQFIEAIKKKPNLTLKGIGHQLGITEHGAKFHRNNVYRTLQVNSRAELVAKLYQEQG